MHFSLEMTLHETHQSVCSTKGDSTYSWGCHRHNALIHINTFIKNGLSRLKRNEICHLIIFLNELVIMTSMHMKHDLKYACKITFNIGYCNSLTHYSIIASVVILHFMKFSKFYKLSYFLSLYHSATSWS